MLLIGFGFRVIFVAIATICNQRRKIFLRLKYMMRRERLISWWLAAPHTRVRR